MKLIATLLLFLPVIAHAGCREPIYLGKPAADEVTKRHYDNCMKAAKPGEKRGQLPPDLIDKQRIQMQQIEQQQGLQVR